ncbi:hypothetical protein TWF481_006678 [Arthrobotrys musiformis]|uniref:Ribosomal protein/NADH dehydrogenase domain-containing protein n=1 Tax=Arthrobotrys musiformis TaxID=47236 RepID=A0AAV9W986_9PEZI
MPSPTSRLRWLRAKLYSVRNGTGAAILPPNISRIALSFNYKSNNGHMGPRKFFRECLPRLKYHNPEVDMTVLRKDALEGPATLTIHFTDTPLPADSKSGKKKQAAPIVRETSSTIDIDMLNRYPDDIMAELVEKTSATLYSEPPRPKELEEEAEYLAVKRENELKEKYKLQRADRRKNKDDKLKDAILA